jgi:hypothetical protein
MKKMKESCKLDINQSVPENILSRPEVKRKQCGGDLWILCKYQGIEMWHLLIITQH